MIVPARPRRAFGGAIVQPLPMLPVGEPVADHFAGLVDIAQVEGDGSGQQQLQAVQA